MADEPNDGIAEEPKRSTLVRTLIMLGVAALLPAIAGIVTYNWVIRPKLAPKPPAAAERMPDEIAPYPEQMTTVVFDDVHVSVHMEDPDVVSPLLILRVALSCTDPVTAGKVQEKKEYFAAEILSLHQGRTRAELNDPLVQKSILEQIKQRSNILLKRLAPGMDLSVLDAMYLKFAMMDIG